ncbi:MAG: DUF5329 family protein [Betaproteobacteria bacterium]|nr:MAG: DUF5329 family protein [Betaproteobacteria bacterium]
MRRDDCARWLSLILLVCCAGQLFAALDETAQREIDYLLTRLETSDCRFFRNGKWYDAKRAREHLEKKYAWLARRDLVDSAEQFIERAASKSSRSGEPCLVQCGEAREVPSANWLT